MHPSQAISKTPPPFADRPFPWKCRHCGRQEVVLATVEYTAEVQHDGQLHEFNIAKLELPVCQACGERVFTEQVDAQINDALRSHLHLLTPEQMRDGIQRIGLSQQELASRLGIAEATLSHWLNKCQIQSRAMDNLLRTFFAFPQVRAALGDAQPIDFGLADVTV